MSKRLFKTMVAVLAIAAAAAGPVRGQSNQKYTSAVAMSALQVGDTLAEGFSLTGEDANFIYLVANRHKHNENLSGSLENITLGWIQSIGANCVFSTLVYDEVFTTFAPVDENGRDGDAWVVTEVESIADFTNITIAGIRIPGPPHTVRMAEGTVEAANWSLASGNESVTGTAVLENVMSGSPLTATYNGTTKKVKSVKAVKYVAPAATVATAPTATGAIIEVGSTAALVNAGAAIGGTMMYAVTATNAQPASADGFSASVPTAEDRAAGTYYVWYYVEGDASHTDSEIAGPVSVTLAVMTTVTWNSTNVFNSDHMNDEIRAWESGSLAYEDITISKLGTSVSSFYPYDNHAQAGSLKCHGDEGDSFTFTAPSGKKFCKIEIIDNESINFPNYGDWTQPAYNKAVWSGTAANTVTLGTVYTVASNLNSIVFTLIDD